MSKLRKIICLIMALMLITIATACTRANNNVPGTTGAAGAVTYKDGTYTGAGDPWENGSEDATVTVKGGKIESIILRRLDKTGKEVDYNIFAGQTKDGKTYPNLKKFREDMASAMISKQSANVDTISGATTSTKNWISAVQRALDKAK